MEKRLKDLPLKLQEELGFLVIEKESNPTVRYICGILKKSILSIDSRGLISMEMDGFRDRCNDALNSVNRYKLEQGGVK